MVVKFDVAAPFNFAELRVLGRLQYDRERADPLHRCLSTTTRRLFRRYRRRRKQRWDLRQRVSVDQELEPESPAGVAETRHDGAAAAVHAQQQRHRHRIHGPLSTSNPGEHRRYADPRPDDHAFAGRQSDADPTAVLPELDVQCVRHPGQPPRPSDLRRLDGRRRSRQPAVRMLFAAVGDYPELRQRLLRAFQRWPMDPAAQIVSVEIANNYNQQ